MIVGEIKLEVVLEIERASERDIDKDREERNVEIHRQRERERETSNIGMLLNVQRILGKPTTCKESIDL